MAYSATLTITRTEGGSQNANGVYTPGAASSVFAGAVDAQDVDIIFANASGEISRDQEIQAFLMDESAITTLVVGDIGLLTYGGLSQNIVITGVRRIDGAITLKAANQ